MNSESTAPSSDKNVPRHTAVQIEATWKIYESILEASKVVPVSDLLTLAAGVLVTLASEVASKEGRDPKKEIKLDGGTYRDITLHEEKS